MESVAAYLLCVENGLEPTKDKITQIISTVNPDFSKESLDLFMSKIEGKTHEEILKVGSEKMASQVVATSSAAGQTAEKVEEAEIEPEEESEEVLDMF
ncbi:hypothetical protein NUSPORA_02881 [Nucleospora cyclopteri]